MDAIAAWLASNGGSVGFAGLVTLAIWLIYTGRLVPKSSVDASRADWGASMGSKDSQIQDWKEATFRLQDTVTVKDRQIDELIQAFQALVTQSKEAP